MTAVQKFGQIARKARLAKNWVQQKVVQEVNMLLSSKKSEWLTRQTLTNLECGVLKKKLSVERRSALCKVLEISEAEMSKAVDDSIPVQTDDSLKAHDVLPLLRRIAGSSGLEKLTFEQFCRLCESDQRCKEVGVDLSSLLAK